MWILLKWLRPGEKSIMESCHLLPGAQRKAAVGKGGYLLGLPRNHVRILEDTSKPQASHLRILI